MFFTRVLALLSIAFIVVACSGSWQFAPKPATQAATMSAPVRQFPSRGDSRLYVAWVQARCCAPAQVRVYDRQLTREPKLLATLRTPYPLVNGLVTDAQGNLYAAVCGVCSNDYSSSGIAVFKNGAGKPSLDYLAPRGEDPMHVVVAADGTVYSANRFCFSCAYHLFDIEIYHVGHKHPTEKIVFPEAATYDLYGMTLDAQNNIWIAYQTNPGNQIYAVEYTPASREFTTYKVPGQYAGLFGALTFDRAGHLLIGLCEVKGSTPTACGTAVLKVPSMKRVALIKIPHCPMYVHGALVCASAVSVALDARNTQLWTTSGAVVGGFTYPAGRNKAYFHITGDSISYGAYAVAIRN